MNTPIYDFVKNYAGKKGARFHMPGHKGTPFLGCEALDITEVCGADALYEAGGIIAESEANATKLFGTGQTLFSTEGSSQCIRAMLYLAVNYWKKNVADSTRPYIIAARNVHKSFLYAAALIDFDVVWLYPEEMHSLCSCHISPEQLENTLKTQISLKDTAPAAVYVTSPDYLGGQLDIKALADICHKYGTLLTVDNAHGSYLHFLEKPMHPMDLGADICCDSAHKTLPVLTGGAYLHINRQFPALFLCQEIAYPVKTDTINSHNAITSHAKTAMSLFGSTSPSYLTLASLDLCNAYLSDGYVEKLAETINILEKARHFLRENGWTIETTDPLKLTIRATGEMTGFELADNLRSLDVECEYADMEYVVLMATPENTLEDYGRLFSALGKNPSENANLNLDNTNINLNNTSINSDNTSINSNNTSMNLDNTSTNSDNCCDSSNHDRNKHPSLKPVRCEQKCSIREAIFASHERIPTAKSLGRICGTPTVGCPPAIPIVVSGELIDENAIALLEYYGITEIDVIV